MRAPRAVPPGLIEAVRDAHGGMEGATDAEVIRTCLLMAAAAGSSGVWLAHALLHATAKARMDGFVTGAEFAKRRPEEDPAAEATAFGRRERELIDSGEPADWQTAGIAPYQSAVLGEGAARLGRGDQGVRRRSARRGVTRRPVLSYPLARGANR